MESLRKANRSLAVLLLAALAAGMLSRSAYGADYPAVRQGGLYMFNYYFPPAPASTPWAPSWSPDGKWIAVGMEGSLWKVDPATGAAIELVHDRRYRLFTQLVAGRPMDHLYRRR